MKHRRNRKQVVSSSEEEEDPQDEVAVGSLLLLGGSKQISGPGEASDPGDPMAQVKRRKRSTRPRKTEPRLQPAGGAVVRLPLASTLQRPTREKAEALGEEVDDSDDGGEPDNTPELARDEQMAQRKDQLGYEATTEYLQGTLSGWFNPMPTSDASDGLARFLASEEEASESRDGLGKNMDRLDAATKNYLQELRSGSFNAIAISDAPLRFQNLKPYEPNDQPTVEFQQPAPEPKDDIPDQAVNEHGPYSNFLAQAPRAAAPSAPDLNLRLAALPATSHDREEQANAGHGQFSWDMLQPLNHIPGAVVNELEPSANFLVQPPRAAAPSRLDLTLRLDAPPATSQDGQEQSSAGHGQSSWYMPQPSSSVPKRPSKKR